MRLRTGLLADPTLSGEATRAQEEAKFLGVPPQEATNILAIKKLRGAMQANPQQSPMGPPPPDEEEDLPARAGAQPTGGVPLPPPRPPGIGGPPPGYMPAQPIPFGELQRRWGVPRLEDL